MTPEKHPYHNPETGMENTILVEIVDTYTGPPTPEQLARPRYRRPVRPPQGQPSTFGDGTLVEFTDDGNPPASGDSDPPRRGGPPDEPRGPAAPGAPSNPG